MFYRQSCKASLSAIRTQKHLLGRMFRFRDPVLPNGLVGKAQVDLSTDRPETQLEYGLPLDILGRPPIAANDKELVWPFIPFPEDWCGA
jgi:hypothetical protein